jgi:hypothetical protein
MNREPNSAYLDLDADVFRAEVMTPDFEQLEATAEEPGTNVKYF